MTTKKRNRNLEKNYSPDNIEQKWYSKWIEAGLFNAEINPEAKAFSIVIPPPNVTGSLHVGHAFDHTFQDIMCRTKRMEGYSVLWLPGTDHAGIATQNVVEKDLAKKGISRYDLGREEFVKKVWEWKKIYGSRIIEQMKRLGNSCDWRRERFTLDEGLSKAVRAVFVRLYKKGLIYRGKYIVNWCPRCSTAISDLEVEYSEEQGKFYYVRYPLIDDDGYILVATTRPETIPGDVALAVHPRSEKYKNLIGKNVRVPLSDRIIPVIEDNMVDPDLGTGCLKITPAHAPDDFLIGLKHNLEQIQVIDSQGIMNEKAGKYKGMKIEDARREFVKDLEEAGLLEKTETITHSVGHCQRCGTTVEPYLSEQWFVKTKPLAERGVQAVKDGRIKWVPEQWEKTYFNWMENIRDWCISRQLWWGHRIPAWICKDCGHITVAENDPTECEHCHSKNINQESDVLDTWFSSALWPFSTMGWPDDKPELKYFYPTSLMVTGFDIIFFWVARMIMMGLEFMDDVPFRDVYIHSLIRDEHGKKMSKTKGNVIDPLVMIDKYGADALRMTLAALSVQGRDILLSSTRIETYRFFMNKLWNASRFALMNLDDEVHEIDINQLHMHDKFILTRTQEMASKVRELIDSYDIGTAARMLYDFVWGDVCDWYLEMSKPALKGDEGEERRKTTAGVLEEVFKTTLPLLHPFIPFVTEELWEAFGYGDEFIMKTSWPNPKSEYIFEGINEKMRILQDSVRTLRNLRAEAHVAPQQWLNKAVIRVNSDTETAKILTASLNQIENLCRVHDVILESPETVWTYGASLSSVTGDSEIKLPVGDVLDVEKEISRLKQEIETITKNINSSQARLNKADFVARAPAEVVEKERSKVSEGTAQIERLKTNLESLSK
ncbi:MAG: valine--tRNA ligase [Synergistaceae bacterium]|nr:valine--tRNA ligase [Synergistaceae bacterium]MBR0251927.1 valine--tRNA ligase [Synergistaceae bacterium]